MAAKVQTTPTASMPILKESMEKEEVSAAMSAEPARALGHSRTQRCCSARRECTCQDAEKYVRSLAHQKSDDEDMFVDFRDSHHLAMDAKSDWREGEQKIQLCAFNRIFDITSHA
jgi:hypothetical protein